MYNNRSFPRLIINPNILRNLSLICTTKVLFYNDDGEIHAQIDGISMDSILGLTFSNFCMCNLENKIFNVLKTYLCMLLF